MMQLQLQQLWQELQAQFASNVRLRLAAGLVVAILWGYALVLLADSTPSKMAEIEALQNEIARLQPLQNPAEWTQRSEDARKHLAALDAIQWQETRAGLAPAEVQDWLRQVASKAGLTVREIRLAAAETAQNLPATQPSASASASVADLGSVLRVRLAVDFKPLTLAVLLQELARGDRGVVVERLQMKVWTQPAQAEMDLRVRVRSVQGAR